MSTDPATRTFPASASKLTFALKTSGAFSSRRFSNSSSVCFAINSQYNPAERERPNLLKVEVFSCTQQGKRWESRGISPRFSRSIFVF
jgi:hypothetical protein